MHSPTRITLQRFQPRPGRTVPTPPPRLRKQGVVVAVGADHGFVAGEDGREIYFHATSVRDGRFEDLVPGSRLSYEAGGAAASSVRVLT